MLESQEAHKSYVESVHLNEHSVKQRINTDDRCIPILLEFVPISHRGKIDLDGFIPATIMIVKGITRLTSGLEKSVGY